AVPVPAAPMEAAEAAASSPARPMLRHPTGVVLSPPKQPQPIPGSRRRTTTRAAAEAAKSTAAAPRARSPRGPPSTSSATASSASAATASTWNGRCSDRGSRDAGPCPAAERSAALAAAPSSSISATIGGWIWSSVASTGSPHPQGRGKAAGLGAPAQRHEARQGQFGQPAAGLGPGVPAPVAEPAQRRGAVDHRDRGALPGLVVGEGQGDADGQPGQRQARVGPVAAGAAVVAGVQRRVGGTEQQGARVVVRGAAGRGVVPGDDGGDGGR